MCSIEEKYPHPLGTDTTLPLVMTEASGIKQLDN